MKEFLNKIIRQEKLELVEPSDNISKSYFEKSISNFESANILLKNDKLEESISFVYYSMYNLVISLLYRAGIKSENHSVSIILLKEIFDFDNFLIKEAKVEGIDKQDYVGFEISRKEVEDSLIEAEKFNRELKGFILGWARKILNFIEINSGSYREINEK